MKAHIASNREVSQSECDTLIAALEWFIEDDFDDFEDVSLSKKQQNRTIAISVKQKLLKKSTNFDGEDMRIMYASLGFFEIALNHYKPSDLEFEKEKAQHLKNVKSFQSYLENAFRSQGININ